MKTLQKTLLLIFILIPFLVNAQIFVNQQATGNNNGSSWQNAYTELRDAIENAPVGAEIWIAGGTYLPSSTGSTTASFVISNSLSLYGGFAGTENSLQERILGSASTILSGDYNGDDDIQVTTDPLTINYLNTSDNAQRVVDGSSAVGTIILDGLTIQGGNSNGSGSGAKFSTIDVLTLTIQHCSFKNNNANSNAGALFFSPQGNGNMDIYLTNTSFINNSARFKGGAIWGTGSSTSIFLVNVEYTNCLFKQNYSTDRAGAVTHDLYYNTVYTNCIFDSNRGDDGGATFENSAFDTYYYNCTFYKNNAHSTASAIYNLGNYGNTAVYLYNCIFYEHSGQAQNILRGNSLNSFITSHNIFEADSFSDMLNDIPNSQDLGGNQFAVNPMFVNAEQGDFNLSIGSSAINTGSNTQAQHSTDYTGIISRIVDGVVDLGALEYHLDSVLPGDSNNNGIVNLEDVLYWGLAKNFTGAVRSNATTNCMPEESSDWSQSINGVNSKHQDGDGNGIVDNQDNQVIVSNFGCTYNYTAPSYASGTPIYRIQPQGINNDGKYQYDIYVENGSGAAALAHGLAFTISSDVIPISAIAVSTTGSSLHPDEVFAIPDGNQCHAVLTRTDNFDVTCGGPIAILLVETDDIPLGVPFEINVTSGVKIKADATLDNITGASAFGINAIGYGFRLNASVTHEQCNGLGEALAIPSGGTSPYTYTWSTGASGAQANNLASGSYTVIVTDAIGLSQSLTVQINGQTPIYDTNGNLLCGNLCPEYLAPSGVTGSGLYSASNALNSDATIPTGNTAEYKAGQVIKLDQGFEVQSNAGFSAEIEDCNDN